MPLLHVHIFASITAAFVLCSHECTAIHDLTGEAANVLVALLLIGLMPSHIDMLLMQAGLV